MARTLAAGEARYAIGEALRMKYISVNDGAVARVDALCNAYPEVIVSRQQAWRAGCCAAGTSDFLFTTGVRKQRGTLAEFQRAIHRASESRLYRERRMVEFREEYIMLALRYAIASALMPGLRGKLDKLYAAICMGAPFYNYDEFLRRVVELV